VTAASIGTEPRWTESRPSSGWLPRLDIAELWSYRELAFFLALRDLKLRYKQTVFGVSWAIIQPLAGIVLFSVVFGRLAGLPSEGIRCRQRRPLRQGLVRLRREELRRLELRFSGLRQLPVQIDGASDSMAGVVSVPVLATPASGRATHASLPPLAARRPGLVSVGGRPVPLE
jgi:hypothetical protein